jgi:hypothetical protein
MNPDSRNMLSEAGALASAGTVAATILCCLPFATGALGAGIAAYGARFEPFRPYLTIFSLACVAFVLVETYRPSASRCGPDGCRVARPTVARQVFVWLLTIAVVLMLTTQWWVSELIYSLL